MKKWLILLALLLVAAAVVFFVLNNPLGRLVKLALEEFGPPMTQADVRVGKVTISATDGAGSISGLRLGNPKGFKTDYALKADKIEIAVEPSSLTQDVIVIHKIVLDAPHLIYEKGDNGSNFDAIQRNVEQYLGSGKSEGKSAGKKMIIESFVVRNAKVNYNGLSDVDLPNIELHDIGKKTGGVTSSSLAKAIVSELNAKTVVALTASAVVGGVSTAAAGAGKAIKGLFGK